MTATDLNKFTWLAKYEAEFCTVCDAIQPILDSLSNEYDINLIHIDATREPIAEEYEVYSVPSFHFYKDWIIKERFIGAMDRETLETKLRNYDILKEKISRF